MNAPLTKSLAGEATEISGEFSEETVGQITVFASFEEAEPIWRAFEAEAELHAFQCFDWLANWHRFSADHAKIVPCIVAVAAPSGETRLLLPLGLRKARGVTLLTWLGRGIADYQGPLLAPGLADRLTRESFAEIWRAVLKALPRFDAVYLERQPARVGDQANPFFALLANRPFSSDAHLTRLTEDYDSYYKSKRGKKSRETDRRKQRRIQDAGEVEFLVPSEDAEIGQVVETMIAQKTRWYGDVGVKNLFDEEGRAAFYAHMTAHHGEGFVHLSALRQGEEILATNLGLVHQGCFYYLMPTYYDGELKRFSPGVLLLRHLFQWCFERQIEVFDFTTGDESYKYDWCEEQLALGYHIQGASLAGRLYAGLFVLAETLKSQLRQRPALFALAKRLQNARS